MAVTGSERSALDASGNHVVPDGDTERRVYRFLARALRPYLRALTYLSVLLAIGLGLSLAGPQLLRVFIDLALGDSPVQDLTWVAGWYVAVAILSQGASVATAAVGTDLAMRATNRVRLDLTRHVLGLDLTYHHKSSPGEQLERVSGDVAELEELLSTFMLQVARDALLLVGALALLFRVHLLIGAVSLTLVLVALVVLAALRRFGVREWHAFRQSYADLTGYTEEHLGGTEDVKGNGAVEHVLLGYLAKARAVLWATVRALNVSSSSTASTRALLAVSQAALLGLAAWLSADGAVTVGEVYLVFAYTGLVAAPVEALGQNATYLKQAVASLRRVTELAETQSILQAPAQPKELPGAAALDVEWEDITFAYDDDAVLNEVSLRVPAGTSLGLLGRTGSGKSTLVRLLPRLYDPQVGQVKVGGVPVSEVDLPLLRSRIAFVTQDVHLFSGSVRDNVTMFDRAVDDERVLAALEQVRLGDWLATLADHLDHTIDPHQMSGGEAQLLAFARAIVRDPAVVVMDEASSRLDRVTEQRLEAATAALLRGRTAIVIAHRLNTVARLDAIAVLADGRLVEHGRREELAGDAESVFARLLAHDAGVREVLA